MAVTTNTVKLPFGFKAKLRCELAADSTLLQLDAECSAYLCALLGRDCYTHLVITDCVRHEIVQVSCAGGDTLLASRGLECTDRLRWPACSEIRFETTPGVITAHTAMAEAIAQAEENENCEGKVNGLSSETLQITEDEDDPQCTVIELPECEEVEFCVPGYRLTFKDGCLTKEVDPETTIKDGVVRRPTLCFKDSKIVNVEPGDALDYTNTCNGCGKCSCTCEDTVETDPLKAIAAETL